MTSVSPGLLQNFVFGLMQFGVEFELSKLLHRAVV